MDMEAMEHQWQRSDPNDGDVIGSGCAPGVVAGGTDEDEAGSAGVIVWDEPTVYEVLTSKTSLTELYENDTVTTSSPKRTKANTEQ